MYGIGLGPDLTLIMHFYCPRLRTVSRPMLYVFDAIYYVALLSSLLSCAHFSCEQMCSFLPLFIDRVAFSPSQTPPVQRAVVPVPDNVHSVVCSRARAFPWWRFRILRYNVPQQKFEIWITGNSTMQRTGCTSSPFSRWLLDQLI